MKHSFIAYIDESGDDGLGNFRQPGGKGGASCWLGISAFLIRATHDLEAVAWRDEIRDTTAKKNKGRSIHFANFNHSQKRVASQILATKPMRFMSVVAHKPSLDSKIFTNKNQLYFYITRHLIERISWFCRDTRPRVKEGDGRVRIVFSRRGGMSYDDFKYYLTSLKSETSSSTIHWPTIDIDSIEAQDHPKLAGLQLADCVASATASAFEPDVFGNTETSYLEALASRLYSRSGNMHSYGLKVLPRIEDISIAPNQRELFEKLKKLG